MLEESHSLHPVNPLRSSASPADAFGGCHRRPSILAALLSAAVLSAFATGADAARPLETAVMPIANRDDPLVFERIRAAGATKVKIPVSWRAVAPTRPGLDAFDPGDPAYRWSAVDTSVRFAVAQGLEPVLMIYSTPAWAESRRGTTPGTGAPDPAALGAFAAAAATRFSSRYQDLPRVRYWQVWNEPNLTLFLQPQFENGRPFAPGWYRKMSNEFAARVKGVDSGNVVIAGGTAPFSNTRWGPLTFMRELLCLDAKLRKKCDERVRFDVWAHHPYTNGGPTRKALRADDVSLGDLRAMGDVLRAGYRTGRIASKRMPRFWVTEFSWDSNPPDPGGVPSGLHARWVAEALYRMWESGVSLVTWFSLQDLALGASPYQSGLYYWSTSLADARPKAALQAFRFPFVAFPAKGGVSVWGRTPAGRSTRVLVEQSFRGGWRQLGVLQTDRYGILQRRFTGASTGFVRARTLDRGDRAAPFSLARVPDRFVNPFGTE